MNEVIVFSLVKEVSLAISTNSKIFINHSSMGSGEKLQRICGAHKGELDQGSPLKERDEGLSTALRLPEQPSLQWSKCTSSLPSCPFRPTSLQQLLMESSLSLPFSNLKQALDNNGNNELQLGNEDEAAGTKEEAHMPKK
ncbi:UNVERIFIED_CONTAM: hypothetical protein K2H54_055329 [Gekko kuhli]